MADIALSRPDRLRLVMALANAVRTSNGIDGALDDIGLPVRLWPAFTGKPEDAWRDALHELEQGAVIDGIRNLLGVILLRYPLNEDFNYIARKYAPEVVPGLETDEHGKARSSTGAPRLRLFVRASTQDERQSLLEMLIDLGLDPVVEYFTAYVTCYNVDNSDPAGVLSALDRTDLDWSPVPPGGPGFLLSSLIVQGPDGRSFRFTDTPAFTTVAEIAADALSLYPERLGPRMTVTDRVRPDGRSERLAPEATLADAGIGDGDQLRVSYQSRAGGPARHVFICYAREDSVEVDRLEAALQAARIPVWRDTVDLWPGDDWRAMIRSAIADKALVFVACFSRKSLARETSYQNEELNLAVQQMRFRRPGQAWLIPVRFDDCAIPDLDIGFGRSLSWIQCADLFPDRFDVTAGRLVTAILRQFDRPIE